MSNRRTTILVAAAAALTAVAAGLPAVAGAVAVTLPGVTPSSAIRLTASSVAALDGSGRFLFSPDAGYANGGQLTTTLNPVAGTSSPFLYQNTRVGGSGYDIPVSQPGTYFVDMFVAETGGAAPGQRIWNVSAEGRTAVSSVDVASQAGANKAWHVLFSAPVTDGTLNLRINAVRGTPVISAIEVDFRKAATSDSELFGEDFNGAAGSAPSSARWGHDLGGNGWGNNELESYTARTSNASLDGAGHLLITARKETYTGTDGITRDYTSARLTSKGKFQFQYGSAAASIRVPAGQGLWPAFWTLGSNIDTVGWPVCGEIDVMENIGSEPAETHGTIHAGGKSGIRWLSGNSATQPTALSAGYHTYGVVWGPTAVSISVDGLTYMTASAEDIMADEWWNFTTPNFLLLNLAVGGTWPGSPDTTTSFPATMSVDYVHVTG
jgi:beta-glucanase (GH16 family)